MPIYEYSCQKCEHKFEKLVFNQNTVIQCPECNSNNVEKLFSAFGFKSSSGFTSSAGNDHDCSGCSSHHCSSCH